MSLKLKSDGELLTADDWNSVVSTLNKALTVKHIHLEVKYPDVSYTLMKFELSLRVE